MSELVAWLRRQVVLTTDEEEIRWVARIRQAADEIERLTARVAELTEVARVAKYITEKVQARHDFQASRVQTAEARVAEMEAEIAERKGAATMSDRKKRLREPLPKWGAAEIKRLIARVAEMEAKYERAGIKCNRGHENILPVSLWNCPMCTDPDDPVRAAGQAVIAAAEAWRKSVGIPERDADSPLAAALARLAAAKGEPCSSKR